jgi:nitrite reductase/ring-hydroxylating ferredoxin subunit
MQLEGIGVASERWASGRLRTTPEQGIAILDVPTAWRDALATQLARWNVSVHVDSRVANVVACTGKQFCNIAVTETKTHALQLIEQLRQRSLELHGIRIHMSGCPSSCANHHTADIGLKGVRVKRLLGTREGFDVLLGGGIAGGLRLGLPFRMGVDVGQLPNLVEEVVREYYLRHRPGETFSDYWRNELARRKPATAKEEDYQPPIWECDVCGHRHAGEDPPVFCPQCAALRRAFARWELGAGSGEPGAASRTDSSLRAPCSLPPAATAAAAEPEVQWTDDGYAVAADVSAVPNDRGLLVRLGAREIALFRVGDQVYALDNACPHAGGPLAEGTLEGGCVTCPLHAWKFDVRTGAGVAPTIASGSAYRTKIENDKVLVQLKAPIREAVFAQA